MSDSIGEAGNGGSISVNNYYRDVLPGGLKPLVVLDIQMWRLCGTFA